MTDIEQKALALLNEVRAEDSGFASVDLTHLRHADMEELKAALLRAIEQHEAFRQEVSDAVEGTLRSVSHWQGCDVEKFRAALTRFIIAKPDPLVEALNDLLWAYDDNGNAMADQLRAAIEKRGGKLTWGEG